MLALKPYSPPVGFTFDQASHQGRMNGEFWPSATQLLSESKLIDFSMVPREVLERKQIMGTRVHAAIHAIDDCDLDEEDTAERFPEILKPLEAYRKFRIHKAFEVGPRVPRMVSKKWKFHGELDEWGWIEGDQRRIYILDHKCSWEMYPSVGPQTAAYAILLEECYGIRAKERYGLQLKEDGSYELHSLKDAIDKSDFLACLQLHWRRRNKYKTITLK